MRFMGGPTPTRRRRASVLRFGMPDCVLDDSRAAKLCLRRHSSCQTVRLATAREPDCASGDSARARLCIWRQPASQTVHLATARKPNCASDVNQGPKSVTGCRQMHSLVGKMSPDAQFGHATVAGCTVWSESCRQKHSLAARLSPETQFGHAAVVRCTVWVPTCRETPGARAGPTRSASGWE